jgi:hypothetical protein
VDELLVGFFAGDGASEPDVDVDEPDGAAEPDDADAEGVLSAWE